MLLKNRTQIKSALLMRKTRLKKTRKAKDKRHSTKAMGTLQKHHKKTIWVHVLYLRSGRTRWKQLANWTPLAESILGCIHEIRPPSSKTSMLHMQYPSRRRRSGILRKNAQGKRPRVYDKTRGGKTGNGKSSRSLSRSHSKISRNIK